MRCLSAAGRRHSSGDAVKTLPAIRTSLGSFGAQTSRYTDTYLDIYQVGRLSDLRMTAMGQWQWCETEAKEGGYHPSGNA
jgi:hypothetical protein